MKILAKGLNKSIPSQVQNTGADDVAKSTWATTLEEERLGWIWRDPDQGLEGKVVAKCFGLQQKTKIRVIDDCSICMLNAACGVKERFKIHAIGHRRNACLGRMGIFKTKAWTLPEDCWKNL